MHLNSCFLGFKPIIPVGVRLSVAGNHLDFVARCYHAAGHFVRAGAAGHIWGVEVLVKVDNFQSNSNPYPECTVQKLSVGLVGVSKEWRPYSHTPAGALEH